MGSSTDRVMVFIDGSNLFWTSRTFKPGYRVDYEKLVKELAGNRNLIRPYFYSAHGVPPNDVQIKFHHRLKYLGFSVVTRPLRQRGGKWVEKGVDVALVTDLLGMAFRNIYDIAIIVSGDKDMEGAIEEVKKLGKRVEVAAFEHAVAGETRMLADKFIPLDKIADKIALAAGTAEENSS